MENTSSGYIAGIEGIQEEAGTAKEKLDGHCQTRSEEAEELATSRAEWRQRVNGSMHPSGCGMNSGASNRNNDTTKSIQYSSDKQWFNIVTYHTCGVL